MRFQKLSKLDMKINVLIGDVAFNKFLSVFIFASLLSTTLFSQAFITTWETTTTDETIEIPGDNALTYNYTVDWGDGTNEVITTSTASHTYTDIGNHTVTITGAFPRILFNGSATSILNIRSIDQWGAIAWSNMASAFEGAQNLIINATDAPDLSLVTDMSRMLSNIPSLEDNGGALGTWDVSGVINMAVMFTGSTNFNVDISGWNVSSVTTFENMFGFCSAFNQNIGIWNTSSANNMTTMFFSANSFNQDISSWDVSGVSGMREMFTDAAAFNQNLGNWDISSITDMTDMLNNTNLSVANYDATLIGWQSLDAGEARIPTSISLGANGLTYSQAAAIARGNLISPNLWTISGDALVGQIPFITTWQTSGTDETITIPTIDGGYLYDINWGDGSQDLNVTGTISHTYALATTYTVTITGNFPRIFFDNGLDKDKILSIEQWGNNVWTSMQNAFLGCSNLVINATDAPDLSIVTSMSSMFNEATSLVDNGGSIGAWDVSNVMDMINTFNLAAAFNGAIGSWDVSNVADMGGLFRGCIAFNQPIGSWDVGNVLSMNNMFANAEAFNQDIGGWNVSNVSNMNSTFLNSSFFNQDISAWDVSLVSDMGAMFSAANAFNQPIGGWNVSNVNNMFAVFSFCGSFDQDLSSWNVSGATNMADMFKGTTVFNQDLSGWDVSGVTLMPGMFAETGAFDQDISTWNVSNVTDMSSMFAAAVFNQEIGAWDVSSVTSMNGMFLNSGFNQDISGWNVGMVTDMNIMFAGNGFFNQPIGSWDVSSVTTMQGMFSGAGAFNQNLGAWDVSLVTDMTDMLNGTSISNTNYDAILTGWSQLILQTGVSLSSGGLQYSPSAESARTVLTDTFGWTITGDALFSLPFIATWQTTNTDEVITIPTNGSGYLYDVDWGDGATNTGVTGSISHTYAIAGPQTISISGIFPRIFFNNSGDKDKITDIVDWGNIGWITMDSAFYGCSNLNISATDPPNLTAVESMVRMFEGATTLNADLSSWDVSNVILLNDMFRDATSFNGDISTWDLSSAVSISGMFFGAEAFEVDISAWDISNVNTLTQTFANAALFNSDISSWNTSAVVEMQETFQGASAFNQDISGWNVSNVTSMVDLFADASSFNIDISGWDVSSVLNMLGVFRNATSFDQDLGNWDVSLVSDMETMFDNTATSTANYDATLTGWSALPSLQTGVTLGVKNLRISAAGLNARNLLTNNFGWTVFGGVPLALDPSGVSPVSFTANWEAEANITQYFLDVSLDAGFTEFVPDYENRSVSSNSDFVNGLNYRTSYFYRVRSFIADGDTTDYSESINITTPISPATIADSTALVRLYNELGGDNWSDNANWLVPGQRIETWSGVVMDFTRVVELDLKENNLTGEFSGFTGRELDIIQALRISGNNISGLPDLTNLTGLLELEVQDNNLDFDDLETNSMITGITYSPQKSMLQLKRELVSEGEDALIDRTVPGSDNTYQWFKDGSLVADLTGGIITLSGVSFSDEGAYSTQVINPNVPGLILETAPVNLLVSSIERDSITLRNIYLTMNGTSWTNRSTWLVDGQPLSAWEGVSISGGNRVDGLDLSNSSVVGTLPEEILDILSLTSLNLSGNDIDSIPELTSLANLNTVDVSDNRLQFDDLEVNASIPNFTYTGQAFDDPDSEIRRAIGTDVILTVERDGNANTYQWFRNDDPVTGATESSYTITNLMFDNMGDYRCEINNTLATDLTFESGTDLVLAITDVNGSITGNNEASITTGTILALKISDDNTSYDSILPRIDIINGAYLYPDLVLGDYLFVVDAADDLYIPTYAESSFLWDEADTTFLRADGQTTDVRMVLNPDATTGAATVGGVFEEDIPGDGRIEARRRVRRVGVALRRRRSSGREGGRAEMEDEFELIARTETDDNGRFDFANIPSGVYRISFEFPGVPLDLNSFVEFEVLEGDRPTKLELEAVATEDGKIVVNEVDIVSVGSLLVSNAFAYPNPAKDFITIDYSQLINTGIALKLIDSSGKEVLARSLITNENMKTSLDISNVRKGVYILQLTNRLDQSRLGTVRIIKK